MTGKSLTSRYQIVDKIGEGGMALVYRGLDTLLHREVAIKVLRDQYASDEQFVERFRREAQAAASLSHPNVVNIYDVGEVDGVYFIVMEYVHGRSLRRVIEEEGRLSPVRAARYALEICEALQHAHERGLIHRDIKPHNILITEDDRVKVTDFGIARAASSSTLTQTGIVIGSVHYFSPEQARGSQIGPQSDLYSLGIVLYEMLTGEVPFTGDSPISVALKQIGEVPPRVTERRPDCPAALARIVERALAKSLSDRYQDAGEMAADLRRYLWTAGAGELENEGNVTRVLPAAGWSQAGRTGRGRRRKASVWAWIGVGALVLVGAVLALLPFARTWFYVAEVRVPDVTGRPVEEARQLLKARQLTMEIAGRVYHERIPVDHVVSQDPEAGRLMKVTRAVRVTVSRGPELVVVPDLTGQDLRQADVTLSQAGLKLGRSTEGYSADIAAGLIMAQDPPPFGRLEKGMQVDVTVSRGPSPNAVIVPNLIGMAYDQAVNELGAAGLVVGRVITEPRPVNAFQPGTVIDQNPPPDTAVSPGTGVDLVVTEVPGAAGAGGPAAAARVKRATVTVTVPPGPNEQTVSIVLIDAQGTREVYRQVHAPGDVVTRVVQGVGDRLRVRVYLDGTLLKEETIQ
ncbi:MAG TPA: protein kinase [Firmicutes bacterium]|nr:protein kinase [Bacillota bacterium]